MKLNFTHWLPLACALLPLAAPGAELPTKPLWEIQARLDGATSPVFSRNIEEFFGKKVLKEIFSGHTVLRMAGFKNDKTPEGNWIAEIRGMQGIKEMFPAENEEAEFAMWSDDSETLKFAKPKTNKGQVIEEMVTLKDEVWLSGWIDFKQLKGAGIQSKLLKLAENVSFTAAGTGDVVTVTVRPVFDSPTTATAVSSWLTQFQDLLRKLNVILLKPQIVCEVDGNAVAIRMNFKEQDLEHLCDKLKHTITKAREKTPSHPRH